MTEKKKVVFFDMEGTLFQGVGKRFDSSASTSAWALLAERMGPEVDAAEFEHYKKWKRGEYENYLPWMEDTSKLFRRHSMSKKFFHDVIDSIDYFSGVREAVAALHEHGYRSAVITGGFHEQVQRAVQDLGIHHSYASCKYFWDEEGLLKDWEFSEHGLEGKVNAASEVAAQYGVSLSECAFVGDGSNDVHIARAVGISVAFNGEKALQDVATHSVNQEKGKEDFRAVLEYLM